jgi:hypothetical protein
LGLISSDGPDATARFATQSWISGRRIDEDNDEGLWVETAGGLSPLVRESGRVAGAGKGKTTFGPSLVTFGGRGENVPIVMNGAGVIAFGAVLRSSRTVVNSIWTTRSGAPERLLSGALPISGQGTGDPAPGLSAGARFGSFRSVALNEAGAIAFQGFADEFGDLSRLTEAIWWDAPGSLTLALATGHPAPGVPGATAASLRFESLRDDGSLIASAFLTGGVVTPSSDRVLYRFSALGAATVLLREGSDVEVVDASGGRTRRTVTGFRVGQGSSSDGTLVLDVTFTDGTGGVYLLKP